MLSRVRLTGVADVGAFLFLFKLAFERDAGFLRGVVVLRRAVLLP